MLKEMLYLRSNENLHACQNSDEMEIIHSDI